MLLFLANNIQIGGQPIVDSNLYQTVSRNTLPAYIELFVVDFTMISGIGTTYYITNNLTPVNFGHSTPGVPQTYQPFPVMLEGIDSKSDGAPARPILSIANLTTTTGLAMKFIGSLAFAHEDLVGAKITYIRTFANYLNLSSQISAPPLKYTIGKKLSHNKISLQFELRSPLDKERAFLPKRQMLRRDFPGLGINKQIG